MNIPIVFLHTPYIGYSYPIYRIFLRWLVQSIRSLRSGMDGDLIPTGPLEAAVHNRRGANLAIFGLCRREVRRLFLGSLLNWKILGLLVMFCWEHPFRQEKHQASHAERKPWIAVLKKFRDFWLGVWKMDPLSCRDSYSGMVFFHGTSSQNFHVYGPAGHRLLPLLRALGHPQVGLRDDHFHETRFT